MMACDIPDHERPNRETKVPAIAAVLVIPANHRPCMLLEQGCPEQRGGQIHSGMGGYKRTALLTPFLPIRAMRTIDYRTPKIS